MNTKDSSVVTRTARHIKTPPISAEQCLQNLQMSKQNDQYICMDGIYRCFEQDIRPGNYEHTHKDQEEEYKHNVTKIIKSQETKYKNI